MGAWIVPFARAASDFPRAMAECELRPASLDRENRVNSETQEILREYETSKDLAWLIRALMQVGRDTNPPSVVASLESLQSMLAARGQYEELLYALEVVKRSLPGYAEYIAEIVAMTPPDALELQRRFEDPNITDAEREALKLEAAAMMVGNSGMSPQEWLAITRQLIDPSVPKETKRVLNERLTQMRIEKHARRSD